MPAVSGTSACRPPNSPDQRQIEANPVERDQSERQHDAARVPVLRQAGLTVGRPAEGAQQPQLVGRALLVVEDDVPEQGQGAGAVIGQAQRDSRPGDLRPAHLIRCLHGADDHRAEFVARQMMSGVIVAGKRIASSRNAPERVGHCLTRMLPSLRHFVNA
jgi:hypothetical protein